MACGGRVYKGDTVTISAPFDVDDYSNLTITYTTTGDSKIVKTQEEVEIEDGFITYTFEPGELDILPDGVIYYTIAYDVIGVPNVDSTNTNLYLKAPAGYSGKTAEDIYQDGYAAGYQSGYTDGHIFSGSFYETEIECIRIDFTGQSSVLLGPTDNHRWIIDDKIAHTGCITEIQGTRIIQFVTRIADAESIAVSKVELYTPTRRFDSLEDFTVTNLTINYVWHPKILSQTKRTEGSYTYVTLELE